MMAKKTLVLGIDSDEGRELSVVEDPEFYPHTIQIQVKQDGNDAYVDLYTDEVERLRDYLSDYLKRIR